MRPAATRSWTRHEEGHGWLGIRFQAEPRGRPSEIIVHARMWDGENARQQEALGILGVNLISAAFYDNARPEVLIGALMDGLTRDRMEVDMIRFSGPLFTGMDNRLMSLQLVEQRLTNAALFAPDGEAVEPAELLHGVPVLIERGSFRPVTRVTLAMLEQPLARMQSETAEGGRAPVVLLEMTLRNLMSLGERVEHADFLARMDTLRALGMTVMVSNYSRFYNVTTYLRRYTRERIGMVLGVPTLSQILEERHYQDLEGGILEALGHLLGGPVRLYVHPWRNRESGERVTAETFKVPGRVGHLYSYMRENGYVQSIPAHAEAGLDVMPREVLTLLQSGSPEWESLVPEAAVRVIKERRLFGYRAALSS